MTIDRKQLSVVWGLILIVALGLWSCGDKKTEEVTPTDDETHIAMIQESLTEAITRWHYRDKAVLYDFEFEYMQDDTTFDEYLKFPQIQWMEADTVEALRVKSVEFYERDSADVAVEITFVGPQGDTSYTDDIYRLYFHRDRWIRPTVSLPNIQASYEEEIRVADSAASAEEEFFDE